MAWAVPEARHSGAVLEAGSVTETWRLFPTAKRRLSGLAATFWRGKEARSPLLSGVHLEGARRRDFARTPATHSLCFSKAQHAWP